MPDFVSRADEVLGYVVGLGVLVGVLALMIIGGRMIHANFTGDPWIAARGMSDLPWVLLGMVLLAGSGILAGSLLQGSMHTTEMALPDLLAEGVEYQEKQEENSIGDDCLWDDDQNIGVCPEDEGWDELAASLPVESAYDPRCLQGDYNNCYEYCFSSPPPVLPDNSNCFSQEAYEEGWIWADYACPSVYNLVERGEAPSCPEAPELDDLPEALKDDREGPIKYYTCTHYQGWTQALVKDLGGDISPDDHWCKDV